jgi:hypothetical protein
LVAAATAIQLSSIAPDGSTVRTSMDCMRNVRNIIRADQ